MRRLLVILAFTAAVAAIVPAPIPVGAETAPEPAPSAVHPLNNVIRLDRDGTRTALCCCGAEFKVSDKTTSLPREGTTFFMCTQACRDASAKETPAQAQRTLATWREKYAGVKLASNLAVKDGQQTALCGCGKSFVVAKDTPVLEENGVRLYCCGEECHQALLRMTPETRLAKEMKAATQVPEPAKAQM